MSLDVFPVFYADYLVLAIQLLRRRYFARAMLDQIQSPFEGPYAVSVLAVYHSAKWIQQMFPLAIRSFLEETLRIPDLWSFSLVSSVNLASCTFWCC